MMINFICICTAKSLNVETYSLEFPRNICLGVISGNIFISVALRKCKQDYKILNIILVQDFSPLIIEQ